jgi:hypothetical protein
MTLYTLYFYFTHEELILIEQLSTQLIPFQKIRFTALTSEALTL